jgi:hypothetical protein
VDTIYSTDAAFAAKMRDGSVVTWGGAGMGGDSSGVQAELKQGVDAIYSNDWAFAATKTDGRVVTWGQADYGGDSSDLQAELLPKLSELGKSFLSTYLIPDVTNIVLGYLY